MTDTDFRIKKRLTTPRSEQETILTYDKELDSWHIFTDNPVHARKWESLVAPSDLYTSSKTYNEQTGELIGLEGDITGTVAVMKKRTQTEQQKEAARVRMQNLHKRKT
ncbi:TPA: hypothetical protein U1C38_001545 [Streptococcus suis]|nr:hypothetical protein [Streptococcus suis]